tara:strand:- start:22594 stop:23694 length:1101 start_codon:yes stop_codon:yes gene_type:complete
MKKKKVLITGLKFACTNYFSSHKNALKKDFEVRIIPVEEILKNYKRVANPILIFSYVLKFIFYLNTNKINIVITAGPQIGFINVISCLVNRSESWHWFTGLIWSNKKFSFLKLTYWIDIFILIFSKRVFADSYWQKNIIQEKMIFGRKLNKKISVPRNSSITAVEDRIYQIKEKKLYYHNKKENFLKIGYLGRLTLEKGINVIPKISSYFKKSTNNQIEFIICGPFDSSIGNFKTSLESEKIQIEKLGLDSKLVEIRAFHYPKIDFFEEIDILILPSKREGFGIVAIEAHAAGIPVISSSIGPLKESVIAFNNGLHCENLKDYINAIELLIDKNTYKLFHQNAIVSSEKYKKENFFSDLKDVYYWE